MNDARTSASWPEPLFDLLASGRLAVVLIAILVLLLLLYLFLPQWRGPWEESLRQWVEEKGAVGQVLNALQLTTLRSSWLLRITYGMLLVNLFFCMIRRLGTALIAARLPAGPPRITPRWSRRTVRSRGAAIADLVHGLRRRGYRTVVFDDAVYGLRGRYALAGSWIFHVGILTLMASGALVALGAEPFRGVAGVGEGEPFDIRATPFLGANAPISPDLPDLRFRVESIQAITDGVDIRQFDIRLSSPEGREVTIGINRPHRNGPYQVLPNGFGFMPGWAIVDERGRMLRGAWIKMVPFPLEPAEEIISIGPRTSDVTFRFFPDHALDGAEEALRSHELRNPRFRARVRLRGEILFEGLLEPGQRVPLEGGREFLFLPEIRRYGLLDVMEDEGHTGVFAGFGLMTLGLFVRYGRTRKEVLARVGAGGIELWGQSEILRNLYEEEIDRIAADLSPSRKDLAAQEATP
jgi:hypothetical protein